MKRKFTQLRRILFVKFGRIFKSFGNEPVIRRPKKMTEAEETACDIYLELLHDKESKLHYDIKTQECYISSSDKTLYVFLEAGNVKIINSVFGYDVNVSQKLEGYLLEKFTREMAIRRNVYKREVLSRINQSLDSTLEKLKSKKDGNRKNEIKRITTNA
jgi:hypothetical protein